VHADTWNPDWSPGAFLCHLAEDTSILHVGLIVGATALALWTFLV
jgi:hypothetical protein